jgi:phosphatidate cytidylyltransferase
MNNVGKRLLVFFIGIPIIICIVLLSFYNHLILNICIMAAAILGAREFYRMLAPSYKLLPLPAIMILSGTLSIVSYILGIIGLDLNIVSWIYVFEVVILMGILAFTEKEFSNSVTELALSALIIFYCGYLCTFISRLTFLQEYSTQFIILFFLLVFMCDSLAWFFGVLFGKSTRGYVAVSPNKSLVGFLGGIVGSIASGILMKLLCPEVFAGPFWKMIVLSVVCGLSTIVGDLIESIFKRSCNVKDSGVLIPGRGGVLDSVDSLLATAPVYFILIFFLYLR